MKENLLVAAIFCAALLRSTLLESQSTAAFAAADAVEKALENVSLGMKRADFLIAKPLKPTNGGADFRTQCEEKIGRSGLVEAVYFFDNDGERPLYQIELLFKTTGLARSVGEEMFGEPNWPERPGHWAVDAMPGGATVAWLDGPKLAIAADLEGTEWAGHPLFDLPKDVLQQFEAPSPAEWGEGDWAAFFETLDRQLDEASSNFKALRGSLVGEAGSGMVDCTAPLAQALYASIFQNDENEWTLTNTLDEGIAEPKAAEWALQLGEKLNDPSRFSKKYRFERLAIDGEGPMLRAWRPLGVDGRPLAARIESEAIFIGEEEGWGFDLHIIKENR